ncbi:MAG: hypothetical protein FWC82_00100 [Firmicutes bacterium]|nr:hypothetical protein [Bacillota bacterium]
MKKSTIKDIFYGSKGHKETMIMPRSNNKNLKLVSNTYDKLKCKLSPELLTLHQKLVDNLEHIWNNEIDFYFIEGFKLGLLIGIECMET